MSERLEIIKFLRKSEKTVSPGMQPSELISRKDVDWLIQQAERVQELEQVIGDLYENVAAFETLWLEEKRKNQRYKQALENITISSIPLEIDDAVNIARQALEGDDD